MRKRCPHPERWRPRRAKRCENRLIRSGYDPVYGARPLKRAIQREDETALGRSLLCGEAHDGDSVRVDYDPNLGTLTFTPIHRAPAEERVAAGAAS